MSKKLCSTALQFSPMNHDHQKRVKIIHESTMSLDDHVPLSIRSVNQQWHKASLKPDVSTQSNLKSVKCGDVCVTSTTSLFETWNKNKAVMVATMAAKLPVPHLKDMDSTPCLYIPLLQPLKKLIIDYLASHGIFVSLVGENPHYLF